MIAFDALCDSRGYRFIVYQLSYYCVPFRRLHCFVDELLAWSSNHIAIFETVGTVPTVQRSRWLRKDRCQRSFLKKRAATLPGIFSWLLSSFWVG